jgi:hypothetical protein
MLEHESRIVKISARMTGTRPGVAAAKTAAAILIGFLS